MCVSKWSFLVAIRMIAPKLLLVSLLAVALFAVPCMSLSRIACNNVKQGMDVTGTFSIMELH